MTNDYNSFNSKLIIENPLVSIIIPTLNRYLYLKDALHDLENQEYLNFDFVSPWEGTKYIKQEKEKNKSKDTNDQKN